MNSIIKCVILDDEMLAIRYLKPLCEEIENVEVVKAYNNPELFLKEIDSIDCNLCILDIEMPGISGLQIAEQIDQKKKIIFTTAYKEYAAEAFDLNVIDYVRKPIKKERLKQAFEKAFEFIEKEKKPFIEWNSNIGKSVIFTSTIAYIKTSEIDSRDKEVILKDSTSIILKNLSFKILSDILPHQDFVQINKKEMVSKKFIKAFTNTEVILDLNAAGDPSVKLNISEVYRENFLGFMTL